MSETLANIGEFGLIDRIREFLEQEGVLAPGVTLGIGDDTASFRPREGCELLITCDVLVEGRHYLPERIAPAELGKRAMAVNISDIGSMGGKPLYALVSLGLRSETPVPDVLAMYRGFVEALNPYGASVIGGNITKSNDVFIDITLVGEVEQDKILRRSTAKMGNAILVTGYPGQSAAGLGFLLRSEPSEDSRNHPLVREYNTPTPRAREGRAIADSGYATAMIDTSDGFLGDLGHICKESGVGAELLKEKLPISEALRQAADQLGQDPYQLFLGDSDDYELIITCDPDHISKIQDLVREVSQVPVTEVGRITGAHREIRLIAPDGKQSKMTPVGWDHFAE